MRKLTERATDVNGRRVGLPTMADASPTIARLIGVYGADGTGGDDLAVHVVLRSER